MTTNKNYFEDISFCATGFVTFGDGARGLIKEIGKLVGSCLPKLDNVLFVKGLTANMIIISQLCDQRLKVIFNKSECLMIDEESNVHMRGEISKDDSYVWRPRGESKVCEACQFMYVLKRGNQIVSRARKLHPDSVEDAQDKSTGREGSSHMIVDKRNFGSDIHVFEDVYQRRQGRMEKLET